jgi:predicted nucleotidyltransferase
VELQPEWNAFLRVLKHHGVRFVLVGGLAVGIHGHERYTKDLDLLVDPSEANARRLGKALVEFGFTATGRAWRRLTKPYQILTLGVEPVRIDVLTSIGGVAFRSVWKGRGVVATNAGEIPVIGLAELRINKLATGRPQDLADVAQLDAMAREKQVAEVRSPTPSARTTANAPRARGTRKPGRRHPRR